MSRRTRALSLLGVTLAALTANEAMEAEQALVEALYARIMEDFPHVHDLAAREAAEAGQDDESELSVALEAHWSRCLERGMSELDAITEMQKFTNAVVSRTTISKLAERHNCPEETVIAALAQAYHPEDP